MPSDHDRALGIIWGACVGDALGGPVQFTKRGFFDRITGLEYVRPFHKPAGSYSDDGAMTLALAQSFIDANGSYDHVASIQYFLDWHFDGRFSTSAYAWDVGGSTRHALCIWNEGWETARLDDIPSVQRKVENALDLDSCSGNGSLMRISSIGLIMAADIQEAIVAARNQSRITHPAAACVDACVLYTELMARARRGQTKTELAMAIVGFSPAHPTMADRLSKYPSLRDWEEQTDASLRSSGWVIDTLEVALWGLFKFDSWKDGALAVVNLGGDADTAGVVYGALAGALYGFDQIPPEWVDGMQNKDLIESVAEGVSRLLSQQSI